MIKKSEDPLQSSELQPAQREGVVPRSERLRELIEFQTNHVDAHLISEEVSLPWQERFLKLSLEFMAELEQEGTPVESLTWSLQVMRDEVSVSWLSLLGNVVRHLQEDCLLQILEATKRAGGVIQYGHEDLLMSAIQRSKMKVVQWFEQQGASFDGKGGHGKLYQGESLNAFYYAMFSGSVPMLQKIRSLAPQIDLNHKGANRRTLLEVAVELEYPDLVETLCDMGADPKSVGVFKLLQLALLTPGRQRSWEPMLRVLLKEDADAINAQDSYGWSLLHHAVLKKQEKLAELLVEAGIRLDLKNINGRTAKNVAQMEGHHQLVALLTALEERRILDQQTRTMMEKPSPSEDAQLLSKSKRL